MPHHQKEEIPVTRGCNPNNSPPKESTHYLRPSGRLSSDLEAHKLEEDSGGLGGLATTPATSDAAIALCIFRNKARSASSKNLNQMYLSPSKYPHNSTVLRDEKKNLGSRKEKKKSIRQYGIKRTTAYNRSQWVPIFKSHYIYISI